MARAMAMPPYAAVLLVAFGLAVPTSAQTARHEALASAPLVENRPTPETAALLKEELLFQRPTQTYLWALPLINTLGMKVGSEKTFGAGYNGPTRPAQAQNWVKTLPGRGWFPYFRLYGPKEAYFDKSWQLNDIEAVP